ncbi:DUF4249 domain-containing protein [Chryseobacterium sp. G0201]|uniref:DUF4249 domain-containing protein n=1 Tax=Chryseobacterium sp. G0201 TaxID=2487065 RepID=UPI000F4E2034|nr:DUF4249 domain-containing protein [Chryseobacterium sp. G0201]AZA52745.1 DUF4249 domain-containing protein [Chryseobacterium sp. G0201]
MKYIVKFLPAFLLLLCVSCAFEDVVELPIKEKDGKIVIEGNITDQPGPYFIRITRSIKLAQTGETPAVKNAKVILSDNNGQTETLEFENGMYHTTNFTSHPGNTYTLSVTVDGTTYTSKSTMPSLVPLNSLKQVVREQVDSADILGVVPVFTDPVEKGNYYLFKMRLTDHDLDPQVFSDNVDNGMVNTRFIPSTTGFRKNDTVAVEMQCIDNPVYNYFSVLSQAYLNGSGGTTPVNPPSNISNGALGYFSAHTSQTKIIIIQ